MTKGKMMKNTAIILMAFGLMACNDHNVAQTAKNLNLDQLTEIGDNLFGNAIKTECANQLENQGVADLILTAEQKAAACECVAKEVKSSLNMQTYNELIKDGKVNTEVLTSKVTGVMATCTAPENLNPAKPNTEQNEQNTTSTNQENKQQ